MKVMTESEFERQRAIKKAIYDRQQNLEKQRLASLKRQRKIQDKIKKQKEKIAKQRSESRKKFVKRLGTGLVSFKLTPKRKKKQNKILSRKSRIRII